MATIHPTAVVSAKAQIDSTVNIGPFSVIGPNVAIGQGTTLASHVVIDGHTTIGKNCQIFSGACLGTAPQDKKYKNEISYLEVGSDNVIREYVTMNASATEGGKTIVGDRNFIMINSHIAHDCVVGSDITIANATVLGGHVKVEDQVVIGGCSGIHQFVRVGKMAMIGGFTKVVMDVPPFSICDGNPSRVHGINSVGLKRLKFSSSDLSLIKKATKILFLSGLSLPNASKKVKNELGDNFNIQYLLEFIQKSKRGVLRGSDIGN